MEQNKEKKRIQKTEVNIERESPHYHKSCHFYFVQHSLMTAFRLIIVGGKHEKKLQNFGEERNKIHEAIITHFLQFISKWRSICRDHIVCYG